MELSRELIKFEDTEKVLFLINGFHDRIINFEKIGPNTLVLAGEDVEYDYHEIEIKTKNDLYDSVEIYYEKHGRKLSGRKETRKNDKLLQMLNGYESFHVYVSMNNLYIHCSTMKEKRASDCKKIIVLKNVESLFVRK